MDRYVLVVKDKDIFHKKHCIVVESNSYEAVDNLTTHFCLEKILDIDERIANFITTKTLNQMITYNKKEFLNLFCWTNEEV